MFQFPTVLTLLFVLIATCDAKRNGKKRGGRNVGAKRRVWHLAVDEAECGKSEKLMKEEKPSDLCTEVRNKNSSYDR